MSLPDAGVLARLAVRARIGDRAALDALLRALQEPLLHHINAIVRDDDLTHDVLQEVLWIVCRRMGSLREPRWIRAWAYRIATREAVRRSRHERRREQVDLGPDLPDVAAVPSGDAELEPELLARLPSLVGALSPGSESVIRMHYSDGLTIAEIAEALELAPGTVKSRLAYGLSSLRRTLAVR